MSAGSCLGHILVFLVLTILFGPIGGLLYITFLVFIAWLAFQ